MRQHAISKSTQASYSTTRVTLYPKYDKFSVSILINHLRASNIRQISWRVATASEPDERKGYPFSLNSVVPQYSRSSGSLV